MKDSCSYLSPQQMCVREQAFMAEAFASNWIAPPGLQVHARESECIGAVGAPHAFALISGMAALIIPGIDRVLDVIR